MTAAGVAVLHAVWDFSVFAAGVGDSGDLVSVATLVYLLAGVLALASVAVVIRDAGDRVPVAQP